MQYWVQIEVCNIDDCKFIKTRIKEYQNKDEFLKEEIHKKGIILYFISKHDAGNKPFHVYMPLNILSFHFDSWIEEKINILNLIIIYIQFYSGIWMNIHVFMYQEIKYGLKLYYQKYKIHGI